MLHRCSNVLERNAARDARAQDNRLDHARRIGDPLPGDVERRAVIRRRRGNGKPERDVHRAAERRDLDRGHSDVVIRRDHGVELAAHRANEDRVRRKRTENSGRFGGRSQDLVVLRAEPPAVAGVRIQCAQRDPRLIDAEPLRKPSASRSPRRRSRASSRRGTTSRSAKMRRREHHSQRVRSRPHSASSPRASSRRAVR